jgi:hypothetical protein
METVCITETLASTYESTRRQNPEEEQQLLLFSLLIASSLEVRWRHSALLK